MGSHRPAQAVGQLRAARQTGPPPQMLGAKRSRGVSGGKVSSKRLTLGRVPSEELKGLMTSAPAPRAPGNPHPGLPRRWGHGRGVCLPSRRATWGPGPRRPPWRTMWAEARPSSAPWLWRLKHLHVPGKKGGLAGRRQTRRAGQGQGGGQTTTKAQPQPSDPAPSPSFLRTTGVLSPQPRKVLKSLSEYRNPPQSDGLHGWHVWTWTKAGHRRQAGHGHSPAGPQAPERAIE